MTNRGVLILSLTLPMSAQEPAAALEHARQVNLDRAANLPNLIVDETAKRYKSQRLLPCGASRQVRQLVRSTEGGLG